MRLLDTLIMSVSFAANLMALYRDTVNCPGIAGGSDS